MRRRPARAAEKAFLLGNKSKLKGAFAVDAGSTELLGPALAAIGLTGKIPAGGFDLTPGTLTAIKTGQLDFTIDQDPYLQGFLPALYLYLFNLTGGLVLPPDTDTGLTFVTKSNVGPVPQHEDQLRGLRPREAHPGAAVRPDPEPDRHHEHLTGAGTTGLGRWRAGDRILACDRGQSGRRRARRRQRREHGRTEG